MLTLENIQWELPGGEQIVRGIDLTVAAGKLTVITGPNGGGKTLAGKADCRSGETDRGKDPSGRRRYYRADDHGESKKGDRLCVFSSRCASRVLPCAI